MRYAQIKGGQKLHLVCEAGEEYYGQIIRAGTVSAPLCKASHFNGSPLSPRRAPMRDMAREIRDEILAAEEADPCPFGLVHVKDYEIAIATEALRKNTNYLLSEGGARNLAYSVLIALRAAHFDWHTERALQSGGR